MLSKNRGGRPRNNWTPSRRRQLVRLYTTTSLKNEEIQKLLASDDFKPSRRDIQTRLRQLLPSDYSVSHRSLRPANISAVKLRLEALRQCRKTRAVVYPHRRGLNQAARAIRANGTPELLGLCVGYRGYKLPYSLAQDIAAVSNLNDSHLTDPSSLMLDGSNIAEHQVITSHEPVKVERHLLRGVLADHSTSLRDKELLSNTFAESSPKVSFDTVRSQLGEDRSDDYAKQVTSALTATDSRRSSIASLTASLESCQISTQQELAIHSQQFEASRSSESVIDLVSRQKDFSELEREIWNELIDEAQCDSAPMLGNVPRLRSRFAGQVEVSLATRTCCVAPDRIDDADRCGFCGFTLTHHLAKLSLGRVLRNADAVHEKDYFGNTLLHCAVATGEMNLIGIRYLIGQGVVIDAVNTFGETFLHLIRFVDLDSVEDYSNLLRLLSEMSFPFWKRDVHGRTFLHVLFEASPTQIVQDKIMRNILSIVRPNLQDMDNQGHTLQRLLDLELGTRSFVSAPDAPKLLDLKPNLLGDSMSVNGEAWKEIWSDRQPWDTANWTHCKTSSNQLDWIDSTGDNILSSFLKLESWDKGSDEPSILGKLKSLLTLGVPVHLRDKDGNTALAIAAVRGLRPALSMLLSSGANCNTRNYEGTGILSQASLRMLKASREDDDRRYATILSCFTLLVESGAKAEPTQREEWVDRSHRGI